MVDLADIDETDVWMFIFKKRECRYTDLINYFVPKKCAKQTLINYKKFLEKQGKVKKKISAKTNRPVYYVPEEWKQEIANVMEKEEFKQQIDKMSPQEIRLMREEFYREFFE